MQLSMLLLIVVAGAQAYSAEFEEDLWKAYKLNYGKRYSPEEDRVHFEIFKKRQDKIDEHNKLYDAGKSSSYMELNQFSDIMDTE